MDELEISGKRYISSRRAGKENKYHADYIGQLIRAKKVEGQKVGRAWYVNANSLAEYLGKEAAPHAPLSQLAHVVKKVEELGVAEMEEAETGEVVEVVSEAKIEPEASPMFYRTTREAREARSSLRYVADESPLLPRIQKQEVPKQVPQNNITVRHEANASPRRPVVAAPAPIPTKIFERAPEYYVEEEAYEAPAPVPLRVLPDHEVSHAPVKKRNSAPLWVRSAAVLALGAVVFAVAALASTHLLFTVTVDGGQAANAGYSVK